MQDIAPPPPIIDTFDVDRRLDRLERMRAAKTSPEALRKAATEFEAVFTRQVVEMMFKGVDDDAIFGGGHAGRTFKTFLYDEYARIMAEQGAFGVGDMVYEDAMKRFGHTGHTVDTIGRPPMPAAAPDPEIPPDGDR